MAFEKAEAELLKFALSYPDAREDHPWGETVVKVGKKVFVFLGKPESGFGLSVKLPQSGAMALTLPFTEPTGYGLGKSGWVSASFTKKDPPPVPMLKEWIDESYRAVAPKKLVKALSAPEPAAPTRSSRRPGTARPRRTRRPARG